MNPRFELAQKLNELKEPEKKKSIPQWISITQLKYISIAISAIGFV
jgi:hypothetical protein